MFSAGRRATCTRCAMGSADILFVGRNPEWNRGAKAEPDPCLAHHRATSAGRGRRDSEVLQPVGGRATHRGRGLCRASTTVSPARPPRRWPWVECFTVLPGPPPGPRCRPGPGRGRTRTFQSTRNRHPRASPRTSPAISAGGPHLGPQRHREPAICDGVRNPPMISSHRPLGGHVDISSPRLARSQVGPGALAHAAPGVGPTDRTATARRPFRSTISSAATVCPVVIGRARWVRVASHPA